MLSNLSSSARECFDTAKNEARRLKNANLCPEHLLLGLLLRQKSLMNGVLDPYNLSVDHLTKALVQSVGQGDTPSSRRLKVSRGLKATLKQGEDRLIRLDMSEYSESHTVSRLIGSPPGYVGYDREGQLTGRVMSHPFCVILLDEIEKAHLNVLNLFLQVFDDGRLTDAQGRTVTFSDATIIMTSNLVSDLWFERPMGFGADEKRLSLSQDTLLNELRKRLPDEFLSRVDEIVLFDPLDKATVRQIARFKLDAIVRDRFAEQGINVVLDEALIDYVVALGFDRRMGARHLERVIQREILEPLAKETYKPDWGDTMEVIVLLEQGAIQFRKG